MYQAAGKIRMPIQCQAESSLIQHPGMPLTSPVTEQENPSPPFVLKGAPMANPPVSIQGVGQLFRRANPPDSLNYTNAVNYYEVPLLSENIISGATLNTTLDYEQTTFTLQFIALHKNLFYTRSQDAQVSLFFRTNTGFFFHICIPVRYTTDRSLENPFLSNWLSTNPVERSSRFGINQLLNFRGSEQEVQFATLNYCLTYNNGRNRGPYILAIFTKPLYLNSSALPSWLAQDPTFATASNPPTEDAASQGFRRKTFDQILNFMLKGVFNAYTPDNSIDRIVSIEPHISDLGVNTNVVPEYFNTTVKALGGESIPTPGPSAANAGVRNLQNVKCFPINLASQVDDEGNIVIDQTTNRPIDIQSVRGGASAGGTGMAGVNIDDIRADQIKQVEATSKLRYALSWIFLFVVGLAILLTIIVYLMRANSFSSGPSAAGESFLGRTNSGGPGSGPGSGAPGSGDGGLGTGLPTAAAAAAALAGAPQQAVQAVQQAAAGLQSAIAGTKTKQQIAQQQMARRWASSPARQAADAAAAAAAAAATQASIQAAQSAIQAVPSGVPSGPPLAFPMPPTGLPQAPVPAAPRQAIALQP